MSPLALSLRFLQTQPDGRLVTLSRAGHERAFEALVQRYRRPLLAYCRRISPSEASAEDALQQALLQAWIALSTSDVEVRDARAWLYRIVHNVAVSNLRRSLPDSVEVEDAEGASGADHEVERRFAVREALAGLASLPELQRQVMLSTALEGRSHDEIAAALGLSHGAVRGLIYRARATLRAAAAAVTPAPLVHWAVRQQATAGGRSAGIYEALAGGGGAGLGGVLLKGGAIVVSAGAIATAAGTTLTQSHHHAHGRAAVASDRMRATTPASTVAGGTVVGGRLVSATGVSQGRRGGSGSRGRGGRDGGFGSRQGGHGFLLGRSAHGLVGGGGSGSGDGHGSSGPAQHGGTDGGHSGSGASGSSSGSDGGSGGDHHSGGQDASRTGGQTSSGGSGGDHGGGGEGNTLSSTTVTSTSGGSADGQGGGSGGDGGGDRSGTSTMTGSTTTVTTTSTTTSGNASSGG